MAGLGVSVDFTESLLVGIWPPSSMSCAHSGFRPVPLSQEQLAPPAFHDQRAYEQSTGSQRRFPAPQLPHRQRFINQLRGVDCSRVCHGPAIDCRRPNKKIRTTTAENETGNGPASSSAREKKILCRRNAFDTQNAHYEIFGKIPPAPLSLPSWQRRHRYDTSRRRPT